MPQHSQGSATWHRTRLIATAVACQSSLSKRTLADTVLGNEGKMGHEPRVVWFAEPRIADLMDVGRSCMVRLET